MTMIRRATWLTTACAAAVCVTGLVAPTTASAQAARSPSSRTPTSAAPAQHRRSALQAAQRLLWRAEADLRQALSTAREVRLQAASGRLSAQLAEHLAAAQQADDDLTDLQLLGRLLDPENPDSALAGTGLTELVHVPATGLAPSAPTPRTPQQALALATRQVHAAQSRRASAAALLRQIRTPEIVGGPGAAQVVRACADAGATAGICGAVPWSQHHQVFDSVVIGRVVHQRWPQIRRVGGYRPYDPYPDHPSGRAVDIMIPDWDTEAGRELGGEIARYFQLRAEEFGISYMIWRQRQWPATSRVGAWNPMSDRGSPTANHMDHVHITVHGRKGRVFRQLLNQALAAPDPYAA